MTETPVNTQPSRPDQPPGPWPRPIPRIALVLIGSVCAAVGAAIAAKDLCWAPITSGFMAAMIIVLADMILLASLARHFSWGRRVRFLAVLTVIGAIIFLFRLDTERVFRAAFGQDPPSGVTNLTVDSGLQIGPDRAYLMRFNATQAAIDQLAANGRLRPDNERIEAGSCRHMSSQVAEIEIAAMQDPIVVAE